MAAGDRAHGFIELRNGGSLPLGMEFTSTSRAGGLDRALELTTWPSSTACSGPPGSGTAGVTHTIGLGGPNGTTIAGDPTPGVQAAIAMEPGHTRSWCIEVHLPIDADNEVQGATATQEIVADAVHLVDPATTDALIPDD